MNNSDRILCIGEILWDSLPAGLYLGGAPLNVCYHLNQLGIKAEISSRVGNDRLGDEALNRIRRKNISTDYIQQDPEAETGFVKVEISEDGDPTYEILKPVAWDFIEKTTELEKAAKNCWGLIFGTLSQRHEVSRKTVQELWEYDLKKILDLNLRVPYDDKNIVQDSLQVADFVKMNEHELNQIKKWFSLPEYNREAVEQLSSKFKYSLVCITKGERGAMIFQDEGWYEHEGFPVEVEDSVGAGDAFFAALIYGIQKEKKGDELLAYANAAGSLVARKRGALPEYSIRDVQEIIRYQHF